MFSNNNNDDNDIIYNDYFIIDLVRIKVNPSVSVLLFFETRRHTGFLPAAAAHHPTTQPTRCRHRATARSPYCAFVPYYKNTPPQHVPPMDDMELYIITIIILKFGIGIRDSAECRVPSQPARRVLVAPRPSSVTLPSVRARRTQSAPLVPVPPCPTHAYRVRPTKHNLRS